MKSTDPRNPAGYNFLMAHVAHAGSECLLWPFSVTTPGYGAFSYKRIKYLSHRFMCEQKHGPSPDPAFHAAHSCGNRRCVNPNHLSWKSQTDNQLDRRVHGTHNKARTKITASQAAQIRQLKGMETVIQTAARYGITESNVRSIQEGKTWGPRVMEFWTPAEDAALRKALQQRLPIKAVAEAIGKKYGAVTGRMYRLGLGAQTGHPACRRT